MPKVAHVHGVVRHVISVPATVASGTSAEEYVTDLVQGYRFIVEKVSCIIKAPTGLGAGASRTFRVLRTVGTTDTTVATGLIVLANMTKGLIIDIPVTASLAHFANDTDKLTVDVAAGGTTFSTGFEAVFEIIVRESPQAKY